MYLYSGLRSTSYNGHCELRPNFYFPANAQGSSEETAYADEAIMLLFFGGGHVKRLASIVVNGDRLDV